jgi:uncharacterized protein YceH (UPF0502 family)
VDLTEPELRVLGCLIEKQRTTPDAYPLTLNSLRLACNQSTNRDPVVDYDEATVRAAAQHLGTRRLTRFASGAGSRTAKYRHMADETLGLDETELAVLCILMLRGEQTPGELRSRCERLHFFAGTEDLMAALDGLVERGFADCIPRRPGQKEDRFSHTIGRDDDSPALPGPVVAESRAAVAEPQAESRIDRLERELEALRARVAALEED